MHSFHQGLKIPHPPARLTLAHASVKQQQKQQHQKQRPHMQPEAIIWQQQQQKKRSPQQRRGPAPAAAAETAAGAAYQRSTICRPCCLYPQCNCTSTQLLPIRTTCHAFVLHVALQPPTCISAFCCRDRTSMAGGQQWVALLLVTGALLLWQQPVVSPCRQLPAGRCSLCQHMIGTCTDQLEYTPQLLSSPPRTCHLQAVEGACCTFGQPIYSGANFSTSSFGFAFRIATCRWAPGCLRSCVQLYHACSRTAS
jgi:hypothetical protein